MFVLKSWPRSGSKKDHGFWLVGRRHIFRHHPQFEILDYRWLIPTFVGFTFFHVKGMKHDRGVGVYQLDMFLLG